VRELIIELPVERKQTLHSTNGHARARATKQGIVHRDHHSLS
jgi:hypothetical protein